jgi:ATP synthase protein I
MAERRPASRLEAEVRRKAARRLRARQAPRQGVWFGMGMLGMVGWSVALPTVLGALLGLWLDRGRPGGVSWTLNLLILGLLAGVWLAWTWVRRESRLP